MINNELIAALIANDPNITMLNFSYQPIDDNDVISICSALTKNKYVNTLLVNATKITDKGALQIAQLLRVNLCLKRVELARNPAISEECAYQLNEEFNARFFDGKNFLKRIALNPHRNIKPIQETNSITSEHFMNHFFKLQQPVIVRDAVKHSIAYKKWTPQYLAETMRDEEVQLIIHHMDHMIDDSFLYEMSGLTMKMYQAASLIDDISPQNALTTRYYIPQSTMQQYAKIKDDLQLPVFAQDIPSAELVTNLWFGQKDTFSIMHFGNDDNIFVQVYGDKSVLLYPPKDSSYLYSRFPKHQNLEILTTFTRIPNIDVLDEFYQYSKYASPYHAKLSSGDVLFIPKYWWHEFRALDTTSISVNFWFKPPRDHLPEIDNLIDEFVRKPSNEQTVIVNDVLSTCAKKLIDLGKPNHFAGTGERTILQLAVLFHVVDVVKLLLESPLIQPNTTVSINPYTPFFLAIQLGHLDLVKLFLKHNDIHLDQSFDHTGHTPLELAVELGHTHIVDYFFKYS